MSLKKKAAQVRAKGKRNIGEDSVLAHISPKEALQLKLQGGSGRTDPETGLPHFDENDGGGGFGDGNNSGGLSGAPDTGTMGGGGYGTDADGADLGGPDSGSNGGWSDMFTGYPGFGFGDSDLGGFNDVNGFADPAQATGWNTAMSAQDSFDPFSEGNVRKGLSLASGMLGPIGSMAVNSGLAATSKDPGKGFGSMAGGIIGGLLAGPVGAMAGSHLGGKGLSGMGASTADAAAGIAAGKAAGGGDSSTFDLSGVLSGLGGLYQGSQASNNASQSANMAQSQAQSLADMYGPNSPYAQQLRQQLERKDAAGGRRSQFGPREVELQARLAEMASRNAPNVLNANKQAYDMRGAGNKVGGQQLAGLIGLANKTGLTGWAQKGLGDLWNNGTTGMVGNLPTDYGSFTPGSGYSGAPAPTGNGDSGGNFWDSWEF